MRAWCSPLNGRRPLLGPVGHGNTGGNWEHRADHSAGSRNLPTERWDESDASPDGLLAAKGYTPPYQWNP